MQSVRKLKIVFLAFSLVFSVFCFSSVSLGVEYNVSAAADFTGPFAVNMPAYDKGQQCILKWWNDTRGKELGINLVRKAYEVRYDPAVVASLWPGILVGDKPILHLGLGGPDVAALMKRLPDDKVPMFMSTATYGYSWEPNQWVFHFRPTYTHEVAGFLQWVHMNLIKDRPIRVATINTKASPATADQVYGFEAFAKATPWIEFAGVEWVEVKPVSMTSEIRRLARNNPDFIWIGSMQSHVINSIQAVEDLGIKTPLLMCSQNGLQMTYRVIKDWKKLEGYYDSYTCDPGIDPNHPAAKIYQSYKEKEGWQEEWFVGNIQFAAQTILAMRAVERAAAMVGPDKITGEAVYNAMFEKPFTEEELLGLIPTSKFSKEAPFPDKDIKVKATTVKDGKQVLVSDGWIPVPDVPQWVKK